MSKTRSFIYVLSVILVAGFLASAVGLAIIGCMPEYRFEKQEAERLTRIGNLRTRYCWRYIDREAGVVIYQSSDSLAVIPLAETNLD